jgi:hypothetical protein
METSFTAKNTFHQTSQPRISKPARTSREFVEDDLGKAAYLHSIGYEFLGLLDLGRGRFGFTFQDDAGTAAQDAANYFQAKASPHQVVESLRLLKTALVSKKRKTSNYEHNNSSPEFHCYL